MNYWVLHKDDPDGYGPYYFNIKHKISLSRMIYLIDFTGIANPDDKRLAKERMLKRFGLWPQDDLVVITNHDGHLAYSFVEANGYSHTISKLSSEQKKSGFYQKPSKNEGLVTVKESYESPWLDIQPEVCTFDRSSLFPNKGYANICKQDGSQPKAVFTFKTTLLTDRKNTGLSLSSLKRYVRISLVPRSFVYLNHKFKKEYTSYPDNGWVFDGWVAEHLYSAVVQNFNFTVSAQTSNVKVDLSQPKNELDAEDAKRNQWIAEKEFSDPQVSEGDNTVFFLWERIKSKMADSLRSISTSTIFYSGSPVDLDASNPDDYDKVYESGTNVDLPYFEVVYELDANETNSTDFTLTSTVGIKPTYMRV